MKLSIIIVHFNTPELLEKCLDSLVEKKLPEEWEIIVVDNGSNSKLQIPIFKQIQIINIQIITTNQNLGFSKANNIGIAKSTGEYVLLLNPDTIVSQHAIRRVIDYMDVDVRVGIATCKVQLPNGTIDDACHRGFPTPWNALCHFSGIGSLFPHSILFNGYHMGYRNMDRIHELDACVGAFMMIRRSAGEKLKWLDEDYFWYGEDIDFCYRMKKQGMAVVYIPAVSITHVKGASSGIQKHSQHQSSATVQTKAIAQKARFDAMRIFYRKHYHQTYSRFTYRMVMKGIEVMEKFVAE